MTENWKPIPGHPDHEASTLGRIRNPKTGRVLKTRGSALGRERLNLYANGKHVTRTVHRLVALAFHGLPPLGKRFACHNDGDMTNNRADNLRWDDGFGNMADKVPHGTLQCGERNGKSKLTLDAVREIRATPKKYGTMHMLADKHGVALHTIYTIRRRGWRHAAQSDSPERERALR